MKLNIFILIFGIIFGIIFYNKFLQPDSNEIIINKIDTIYQERQNYIRDTVIVKQKVIINRYDTVKKYVDSVFENSNDSDKQKLFDSVYQTSLYDSFKTIEATNSQAKSAIEAKNLWIRDSSLLDICEENVKNCDGSLNKMKEQVDSLKNVPAKNNFWKGFGYGVGTGISIFALTYILLTE